MLSLEPRVRAFAKAYRSANRQVESLSYCVRHPKGQKLWSFRSLDQDLSAGTMAPETVD
jgi:hypothetical protein